MLGRGGSVTTELGRSLATTALRVNDLARSGRSGDLADARARWFGIPKPFFAACYVHAAGSSNAAWT
jgi:hypothetical protein